MNLKDQLSAKQAQLVELKSAIESGDAEAIEKADAIATECESLKESIAKAEKAASMIASLGNSEQKSAKADTTAKSLGEFAAKSLDFAGMRAGYAKSAGTAYGFKAATSAHTAPVIEQLDRRVIDGIRRTEIRGLFGAETISGNSLKYFVLGAAEGAPAVTAENAQKPQFHIPYTPKTASLEKVAGWYYETDELIEDAEFLKSSIDARGLYELDKAIESELMTNLLATSGVQTLAPAGSAIAADDVFKAIMNVKAASDYEADAIVINPADYQTIRLAKDGGTTGQYYGGGCFYGPYGNGAVTTQPGLWGLNTIVSNAVAAGTVLVGAFKQGASVITKANEGARVEVVMGDHDDRTNNRVTVIVEERLALAVRVPAAFVKIA